MGTHIKAPSLVKNADLNLSELVKHDPQRWLGSEKLPDVPFLFKVLSIAKPLSIQAHPDKALAERLHQEQPQHYKDSNHKPELAIALTPFEALFGFRSVQEISKHLQMYPELSKVVGEDVARAFIKSPSTDKVQQVMRCIFTQPAIVVKSQLQQLIMRIATSAREIDALVLRVHKFFPGDVGVFGVFLLNYVNLQPGQALYMGPNHLHAYLSGDCVEVMATSDNVVRAGLTSKYIDVENLVSMLRYECGPPKGQLLGYPHAECRYTLVYDPPIPEFCVHRTEIPPAQSACIPSVNGPQIMMIIQGKGALRVHGDDAAQGVLSVEAGRIFFCSPKVQVEVMVNGEEKENVVVFSAFYALDDEQQ